VVSLAFGEFIKDKSKTEIKKYFDRISNSLNSGRLEKSIELKMTRTHRTLYL